MAKQQKSIDFTSILIVDNNVKLLRETAFLLKVAGFRVAAADNCAQALELLHRRFDLMIVNGDLPDAEALIGTLKPRAIPFIITSERYALEDLLRVLDLGAADFVPKPYDIYDLLDAVKEVVLPHPVNSAFRQAAG